MQNILVTGSGGLVGSELVSFFAKRDWQVYGVDNNMRADLFGPQGDTTKMQAHLEKQYHNFYPIDCDIRDRQKILNMVKELHPQAIVHSAAQPSHDLAARRPFDDFDINAVGTLNLLEASRQTDPGIPFVYLSTNKVYGDGPNHLPLVELETRWDYREDEQSRGIDEKMPVDDVLHSLFGASKLAADVMVQEYGRYFGMPTCCLRCGCITGPNQRAVELHGFLGYLIKSNVFQFKYTIYGYKGKQVRDNIHSYDLASFIHEFIQNPRVGEVYNLGGGRQNSISILEAFSRIESLSGEKMIYEYSDKNRKGDHQCYISDLTKARRDYPAWSITKDLSCIFEEILLSWKNKSYDQDK